MYQYIAELRKKPDHHKKRVALITAFAVTAVMFVGWASVLLPSSTSTIIADSQASQAADTSSVGSTPFETIKDSAAAVILSIKSLFEKKADNFNFQDEYTKMKDQVQSGDIQLAPK